MIDILHLPHPTNIERVETGPVQFGDDWPGTFIRGDNALTFAHMLGEAMSFIPSEQYLVRAQLAGLVDTLQSCSVGDTGWPPMPVIMQSTIRDNWVKRFDDRKRELIADGMSAEAADDIAALDVIAELRKP